MSINYRKPLIVIFAVTMLMGCSKKQESTVVGTENITESVYASGSIRSKNQYNVYATVAGIVSQIINDEGALVKKGDPILTITNTASEYSAETAKLAAQLSDLSQNKEKLNELLVNLELAKTKLKNDSLLYAKQKNLWNENIGTRNDLDQRELLYKSSKAAYDAALLRYRDTKKSLEFSAKQAQNNYKISSAQQSDFTIKSNVDGKVYAVYKKVGEMVTQQQALAVVGESNNFYLELNIDEYDITKIKLGQKVLITLDSYKGQIFEGTVTKINDLMDEKSRTFKIEAEFTKRPELLYPNTNVEANILINTKQNVLTIPRNYLMNDSLVIVNKTEKRLVKTGLKDYEKVEILSGLKQGDTIYKPVK